MKKQLFILLLIAPLFLNAQSQKSKKILEKVIKVLQEKAVNTKEVDWNAITQEAYRLAENATTPYELGNSIRYLYKSLDDFHGSFRYKDSTFRWIKEKVTYSDVYKAAYAKKGNKFFTKQLDSIGYMRIPTSIQSIAKERTQALQDSLCRILEKQPVGLIFDLRLNGGGHIFSMVMGISTILEYGPVRKDQFIQSDGFYENSVNGPVRIHAFTETCKRINNQIPIAVITGPFTASSAEGLAIILKNRPNTILIGEPTAGWVSSVLGLKVDRNSHINLSIGYMTDANNTEYKTKIQPEIVVEGGDNFDNLLEDAKIQKALEWLARNR